jgi:uncharacterized protein
MGEKQRYVKPFFFNDSVFVYNPLNLERAICDTESYLQLNDKDLPNVLVSEKKVKDSILRGFPKKPDIRVMYLLLTDACNFRCKYCFIEEAFESYPSDYMTKEIAEKALDFFLKKCSFQNKKVIFYGGEPLLNKEVLEFSISKIKKHDKETGQKTSISIVTNGSLIDNKTAKLFRKSNVQVGVSLDGNKEAHNSMRLDAKGKKTFDSVIRGWKLLKKNGVDASISFTLGSHNVNDLEKHITWICAKLKPKAIGFNPPNTIPVKGNPATVSADLITQKLIKAYKIMQEHGIYEDRIYARRITPFIKKKFWLKDCCGCGNEIAVSPEGMIGPCHAFVSSKKYFIKEIPKDEKELKENPIWQEWNRRAPINTEQCQNCTAIALCGGGCPYYSYVTKGDIWALDERSCVLCNTTLTWLLKETYSKIKGENVEVLYRQPMNGDETRFANFVKDLLRENPPMGDVRKLSDPRFVTGMMNLVNNGKAACYFAEEDFEIVGFCNSIYKDQMTKIGIAVKKDHRGKGIATRLLELCLIDAKKDGFRKTIAEIYAANKESIELFENNGFVNTAKVSKIVEYKGKKINELVFEKAL